MNKKTTSEVKCVFDKQVEVGVVYDGARDDREVLEEGELVDLIAVVAARIEQSRPVSNCLLSTTTKCKGFVKVLFSKQ